jgi:phage N-6-adenine-methyltransferase
MGLIGRPRRYESDADRQRAYRQRHTQTVASLQAKAKQKAYLLANSDRWETHPETFAEYDAEFCFTLDVCAEPHNAKCPRYFSPEQNGLLQDWGTATCWMNPPYSQMDAWMEKAYRSAGRGALVVCLVVPRTDTDWWHDWVVGKVAEIRYRKRRERFLLPPNADGVKVRPRHSATFPSIVVIYRPTPSPTRPGFSW